LFYFSFTFVSFRESCLLVSWCVGGRCGMACSDVDRGRSRRPGAEDQGWSHRSVLDGRRSRGRVVPCAVCTVHVKMRGAGLLVEPQNQGRWFLSGLASKPLRRFSPVWPQNRWRWFLSVWPQNLLRRFLCLGLKTMWASVCRLCHKTNEGGQRETRVEI
jgi:hypothetical protein